MLRHFLRRYQRAEHLWVRRAQVNEPSDWPRIVLVGAGCSVSSGDPDAVVHSRADGVVREVDRYLTENAVFQEKRVKGDRTLDETQNGKCERTSKLP